MSANQVVLYVDENGDEAVTEPESTEKANERAGEMSRSGVKVLSVVDAEYGRQRVNPAKDTRVWYRPRGSDKSEDDQFSGLMTYAQAMVAGETLREKGHTIVGLISQQQFEERTGNAVGELFEGGEVPEDTNEPLRRAVERMEKVITRQEQARATVPDRNAESRRYQAVELALRLMEQKKGSLSPREMATTAMADQVVKDAKVIEKYLKGSTPRRPSTT